MIDNMTLFFRKRRKELQKLFFHKKINSNDIVNILKLAGVKPGRPIVVHSSMGNMFNFVDSADDLISAILEYIGPDGTLCMPAYPINKFNANQVFDVNTSKSAAGYLTEVFRKYPGVCRSMNQLHSVCALGKDADYITKDHHKSRICFDEYSPYYRISELKGYTLNIGMPKWFIGTSEHICEATLYGEIPYFTNKFSVEKEYTYITSNNGIIRHKMLAESKDLYIRRKNSYIVDKYFDNTKYFRKKVSNVWITVFDNNYLCKRLEELARQNIFIYKSPSINDIACKL